MSRSTARVTKSVECTIQSMGLFVSSVTDATFN